MSEQDQQSRRGVTIYKSNPFLDGTTVNTRTKRDTISQQGGLIYSRDGEITAAGQSFWKEKLVDNATFIKIYAEGWKSVAQLGTAGTKVFQYLCKELGKTIGKDQTLLAFSLVEGSGDKLGRATFHKGIAELRDAGLIAPTPTQNLYWINPDCIFNGDRLNFITTYTRQDTTTTKAKAAPQLAAKAINSAQIDLEDAITQRTPQGQEKTPIDTTSGK